MNGKFSALALSLGIAATGAILTKPARAIDRPALGDNAIVSATGLVGSEVLGEDGETLGRLHDLVLARSGHPMLAILGTGPAADTPEKLIALPFAELKDAGEGRIRVGATHQQIADRATFTYRDPSVLALAPLGFGASKGSPEITGRDDYLDAWGARIETMGERMDARAKEFNLTAEYQLDQAWSDLQDEWRNIHQSPQQQWSRATSSFEAAVDAFEETWKAENGHDTVQNETK